jgi:hypothetical protein
MLREMQQKEMAWPRISPYTGRKQNCSGPFDITPDIVMRMDLRGTSARSLDYSLTTIVTPPL